MKKVEVIKDQCIACGMCYSMADNVFAPGDDGKSEVINQVVDENVINVAGVCPTGAIIITENEKE